MPMQWEGQTAGAKGEGRSRSSNHLLFLLVSRHSHPTVATAQLWLLQLAPLDHLPIILTNFLQLFTRDLSTGLS